MRVGSSLMKQRKPKHVSLTLDQKLLEKIDARRGYIPRSIFIELLLSEALKQKIDQILIQEMIPQEETET